MRIVKDNNVSSSTIRQLRRTVMNDTKETKKLLGVFSGNIIQELPIRNRDFSLWVLILDNDTPIGYITFEKNEENQIFIKSLYISPSYRGNGNAEVLFNELATISPLIYCKINQGNTAMYKFAKRMGLRGESPRVPSRIQPVWWSNYGPEDRYV